MDINFLKSQFLSILFSETTLGSFIGVLAGYLFIEGKNFLEKRKKQKFIKETKIALEKYIEALFPLWEGYVRYVNESQHHYMNEPRDKAEKNFDPVKKSFEDKIAKIHPLSQDAITKFLVNNRRYFDHTKNIFVITNIQIYSHRLDELKNKLELIKENLKSGIYDDELYDILKNL